MGKNKNIVKSINKITLPIIQQIGFELVDIEYLKEGNNWFLRFFIDHENGIDHHACQLVSNAIESKLDEIDLIPHAYFLEVSSPGIERPLKTIKDYERFKGKKIFLRLYAPKSKHKEFTGTLLGIEKGQIAIIINKEKFFFQMDEVAKAHLLAEF